MNEYPKMLFKSARMYSDSAAVSQALTSKEIQTVIVVDDTSEIVQREDGFGELAALMNVPVPKMKLPAKAANGVDAAT